jgi:nicotinamide-nucleotide amidase
MHAEILAIGDEITSGRTPDTNSQWLSQRCESLGVRVLRHTSVGDELSAMVEVIQATAARSDIVVSTGGLGPTADDLVRQALAEATGQPLVLDPDSLDHVRRLFAHRRRPMPPQNEIQAYFPRGSRVIPNPHGTAPGIAMEIPRGGGACRFFALPGVPAEMKEMFDGSVAGQLRPAGAGGSVIVHRQINVFGAGESQVEAMLPDLIRRGRVPRVGINASQATIILRITAEGNSEEECQLAMEPTVRLIYEKLGVLVFGDGQEQLQHAVGRLLAERNVSLAICEWGTGGLAAAWLGEVDAARQQVRGAAVVSSRETAAGWLARPGEGPPPEAPDELVAWMADGCRRRMGADLGLAVGPFPPQAPPPATPDPVHFALAAPGGVRRKSLPLAAHPDLACAWCAKLALNMVRLALLSGGQTSG